MLPPLTLFFFSRSLIKISLYPPLFSQTLCPHFNKSDKKASVIHKSKWCLPWEGPQFHLIAASFPDVTVDLKYAEQGVCFVGGVIMSQGRVVQSYERAVAEDEVISGEDDIEYSGPFAKLLSMSG